MSDYWTSEDCARYFGCSREHFVKRMGSIPTFPQSGTFPVMVGNRLTRSTPRWKAAEVKVWAAENWTTANAPQHSVSA